MKINRNSYYY
jgi:putative transposase